VALVTTIEPELHVQFKCTPATRIISVAGIAVTLRKNGTNGEASLLRPARFEVPSTLICHPKPAGEGSRFPYPRPQPRPFSSTPPGVISSLSRDLSLPDHQGTMSERPCAHHLVTSQPATPRSLDGARDDTREGMALRTWLVRDEVLQQTHDDTCGKASRGNTVTSARPPCLP
jgi:hypothetical protein